MNALLSTILLLVGLFFLWLAWTIFCITRGVEKTQQQRREIRITGKGMEYSPEELYDIGNPFKGYDGRSNW